MLNILNEAYYGKNPDLLAVEREIETISNEMKKNSNYNPNDSKETKNIEKILTRLFNFEKLYFSISGEMNNVDGFTIPYFIFDRFDKKLLDIKTTKNGISYKNSKDKVLLISIGGYNLIHLTPAQNVAIILHEIGHNFFIQEHQIKQFKARRYINDFTKKLNTLRLKKNLSSGIIIINFVYLITTLFLVITLLFSKSKPTKQVIEEQDKFIKDSYEEVKNNSDEMLVTEKLILKIIGIFPILDRPLKLFMAPILIYIGSNEIRKDQSKGYDEEKFADNFAISYGYGKELSGYMNSPSGNLERSVANDKFSFYALESMALGGMFKYFADPHPSNLYRLNYAIKKLEYELDVNRKYLTKSQINEINQQIKDIRDMTENSQSMMVLINKSLNNAYGYDNKKDSAGSKIKDNEIFDFEKELLKKFIN